MLNQRRFNVDSLNQRWLNVFFQSCVPAEQFLSEGVPEPKVLLRPFPPSIVLTEPPARWYPRHFCGQI